MSRFRLHQDVAVVECDPATRKPREGGKVLDGYIADISEGIIHARYGNGGGFFDLTTGWPVLERVRSLRLVPLCYRCEEPILGEPVTDPGDPAQRAWCSGECHDESGQQWMERAYPSGVAT